MATRLATLPLDCRGSETRNQVKLSGLWVYRDPKVGTLQGYPYLIGLQYKGFYMGYPNPNFCLCAFLGPYKEHTCLGFLIMMSLYKCSKR